jgi:hypothetical protein
MCGLLTNPSLRIQVSGASGSKFTPEPKGAINYKNYDVCLKVCWPEEPKCPEGWVSKAQLMDFTISLTGATELKEICTVPQV